MSYWRCGIGGSGWRSWSSRGGQCRDTPSSQQPRKNPRPTARPEPAATRAGPGARQGRPQSRSVAAATAADVDRMVTVIATYQLSEDGRKACLLAGGDGRAVQQVTMDVPAQDVITRDNVSVKVNAVIFFRVIDPQRAILAVQDYLYSTSQIAQTTLRSVLGQSQLDELLSKREEINVELQRIIDQQTEPWGVKVSAVEVKNVDLPQEMQRAIAKQAEAERERRAKVIHAEGEFQAAQKLSEAAEIIGRNPIALQLRYLQSLVEVASEKNSTTIFPVPIDIIAPFLQAMKKP